MRARKLNYNTPSSPDQMPHPMFLPQSEAIELLKRLSVLYMLSIAIHAAPVLAI